MSKNNSRWKTKSTFLLSAQISYGQWKLNARLLPSLIAGCAQSHWFKSTPGDFSPTAPKWKHGIGCLKFSGQKMTEDHFLLNSWSTLYGHCFIHWWCIPLCSKMIFSFRKMLESFAKQDHLCATFFWPFSSAPSQILTRLHDTKMATMNWLTAPTKNVQTTLGKKVKVLGDFFLVRKKIQAAISNFLNGLFQSGNSMKIGSSRWVQQKWESFMKWSSKEERTCLLERRKIVPNEWNISSGGWRISALKLGHPCLENSSYLRSWRLKSPKSPKR